MTDQPQLTEPVVPLTLRDVALYGLIGALAIGIGAPLAIVVLGLLLDLIDTVQRAFR